MQFFIAQVFWGVVETRHIVKVINQIDALERATSSDSLGQPMIQLTHYLNSGSIEFFMLRYFRERQFGGAQSRLRSEMPMVPFDLSGVTQV